MSQDLWETPLPPEEFDRLVARALADLDGTDGEERLPDTHRAPPLLHSEYRKWSKTRGIARPR